MDRERAARLLGTAAMTGSERVISQPPDARAALAAALLSVDDDDPGILNEIAIDDGAVGPIAAAILAAMPDWHLCRNVSDNPTRPADAAPDAERLRAALGRVLLRLDGLNGLLAAYRVDGRPRESTLRLLDQTENAEAEARAALAPEAPRPKRKRTDWSDVVVDEGDEAP